MKMHGALHPKRDVDRVYLSREIGGRGLIRCGGYIEMEKNKLRWYVRNLVEPMIEGAKGAETVGYDDTVNKKELELDDGKEGTMGKQKIAWTVCRRNFRSNINMKLTEKS